MWEKPDILVTFKLAFLCFSPPSAAQQASRKLTSLWARAERGFQGNKPLHAAPWDCRQGEVLAVMSTQRKPCNIYACLLKACVVLHCCVFCCCKRASPRLHELNQLRYCGQAIDFTGHQIIPGLAEHMPFSTGRSLSLSQINTSNYTTPVSEINSESFMLLWRNQNEETQYRCCNHIEAGAHELFIMKSWVCNGAHEEMVHLSETSKKEPP